MSTTPLKGACVIGQSGGPSSVINCSAYGVIKTALESEYITTVYGMHHGIKGMLNDELMIMDEEDPKNTRSSVLHPVLCPGLLPLQNRQTLKSTIPIISASSRSSRNTTSATSSTTRQRTPWTPAPRSAAICPRSAMSAASWASPKTIDNDLFGTDHCPGFSSAAKYIATSIMECYLDSHVYDTGMVTIIECMGRHAGWLTAAAALACEKGMGPDLIYLPEVDFDMDKFLADVSRIYAANGNCIVAVSEGIHYADGSFVSEAKTAATDGFGHAQLGGLAAMLANVVKERTGAKVRASN